MSVPERLAAALADRYSIARERHFIVTNWFAELQARLDEAGAGR